MNTSTLNKLNEHWLSLSLVVINVFIILLSFIYGNEFYATWVHTYSRFHAYFIHLFIGLSLLTLVSKLFVSQVDKSFRLELINIILFVFVLSTGLVQYFIEDYPNENILIHLILAILAFVAFMGFVFYLPFR